jgi:hypothetical protein
MFFKLAENIFRGFVTISGYETTLKEKFQELHLRLPAECLTKLRIFSEKMLYLT